MADTVKNSSVVSVGSKGGETAEERQTRQVARIAQIYLKEFPTWERIYNDIEKGYNFLAGEQYTQEQVAFYTKKRRPVNVFNVIFTIFNQVLGNFFLTNDRMKIYPKQGGDAATAEALADVLDTLALNSEAKEQFGKTLLCGMNRIGVMYPRYSDELQIDGSLVFGNVDEFELMWDSRAKKDFADDARYMFRSRWMDSDMIMRAWPQHKSKLEGFLRDKDEYIASSSMTADMLRYFTHRYFVDSHENEGQYRVIEFHEKIVERVPVLMNVESGESEVCSLEGKRLDLFLRYHPEMKVVEQDQEIKRVTEVIPALAFHLGERKCQVQDKTWDYVIFSPYNYGKFTHLNFGIMQNAMGPQKHLNDLENVKMDILNKSANVGDSVKPDNIINYDEYLQSGHEPGFTLEVQQNAGIDDTIKSRQAPGIPSGHVEMSQGALDFLFKITNAQANFLGGKQTANENASLFAQRVRQAQNNLVIADVNFRWMKKRVYNKAIKLMQLNMTTERYFLITNPRNGDQREVGLNVKMADNIINNLTLGEYQVGVDDLERNPTARAVRFMEKTELMKIILEALGPQAVDFGWWLEESDFGDVDKLIARINSALQAAGMAGEQQEALGTTQAIIQLAKEKQQLEDGGNGGLSAVSRPAQVAAG